MSAYLSILALVLDEVLHLYGTYSYLFFPFRVPVDAYSAGKLLGLLCLQSTLCLSSLSLLDIGTRVQ